MAQTMALLLCLFFAVGCTKKPPPPAWTTTRRAPSAPAASIAAEEAAENNRFATRLLAQLGPDDVALSPWATRTALGLIAMGARGTTAAELDSAAGFSSDPQVVAERLGATTLALQQLRAVSGHALSGLFVGLTKPLRPEYLALSRTVGAEAQTVDFEADGAELVNRWAAAMTGDVFKQVLPPSAVDENTALVVVSALRLEATWRTPFASDMTRAMPFRVPGAPPILVPMMYTSAHRRFKLTEHYAVASLPFEESRLEMIIVVPAAVDGLPALEAALAADGLSSFVEELSDDRVELYLPAFDQTSSLKLRRPLQGLGARAVFDHSAQLGGIAVSDDLHLTEALHDVSLSVDELGARATGVAAMVVSFGAEARLPAVISADHPFLYFVRELPSGLILFEGRVVRPKSKHAPVPAAGVPPPTRPSRPIEVDLEPQ